VQRHLRRFAELVSNDASTPGQSAWAVGAVGSRLPGTTCLVEALAADCMLRRRGYSPAVRIGVRRGARIIDAHAWVELEGAIVTGTASDISEYVVLSSARAAGAPASNSPRVRLYAALRRARGPSRWRACCLYLGSGLLTRRDLRAASIVRWELYGNPDEGAPSGLEDWEAQVYSGVLRPLDRVLLVGCGTGRDLIELAKLGCEVTGLEQSPRLAERARANLEHVGLTGRVLAEPVESYAADATYDAVVFSLYMYSYIVGRASRVAVLARARAHLSPRGHVVLSYATVQPQSALWIRLARISSVCSGSDWWPQRGDRVRGPLLQPDVLDVEHQFSPDEIAQECRAAGLRVLRDEAINPLFRFAIAAV
jgi:SAM-dependent methyltransferase